MWKSQDVVKREAFKRATHLQRWKGVWWKDYCQTYWRLSDDPHAQHSIGGSRLPNCPRDSTGRHFTRWRQILDLLGGVGVVYQLLQPLFYSMQPTSSAGMCMGWWSHGLASFSCAPRGMCRERGSCTLMNAGTLIVADHFTCCLFASPLLIPCKGWVQYGLGW